MIRPLRALPAAALVGVALAAAEAHADATLDAAGSSLTLLSTKVLADGSTSVTERHRFGSLAGGVDGAGAASVEIDLASVATGIDIRDERMREFLFETAEYPTATVTAQVPPDALEPGVHAIPLELELDLHGAVQSLTVPVVVDADEKGLVVTAVEPILLDAAAFGLDTGIAKLAALAKLMHIPTTVPVSFSLEFDREGTGT